MMQFLSTLKPVISTWLMVILVFAAHAAEIPVWMVFFNENSAQLTLEGQKVVDSAATLALAKPDYRLELIGHDDSVLSDPQSLTLSQERARETARSLVKKGVPANRLLVGGVGSSEPLEPAEKGVPTAVNRFVRIQFLPLTDKTTKAHLQQFKGE